MKIVFRRLAADSILLEPFGLEPFGYVLTQVESLSGLRTLIQAWQLVKSQHIQPMASLKLALLGTDLLPNTSVCELKNLVANDGSITWLGNQSRETRESLLAGTRFVIQAGTESGLSSVVVEAMTYGKAVIAPEIINTHDVVREYGVTFKRDDVGDLARVMLELVKDPMQAAGIGHVARVYVEEEFAWEQFTPSTVSWSDRGRQLGLWLIGRVQTIFNFPAFDKLTKPRLGKFIAHRSGRL